MLQIHIPVVLLLLSISMFQTLLVYSLPLPMGNIVAALQHAVESQQRSSSRSTSSSKSTGSLSIDTSPDDSQLNNIARPTLSSSQSSSSSSLLLSTIAQLPSIFPSIHDDIVIPKTSVSPMLNLQESQLEVYDEAGKTPLAIAVEQGDLEKTTLLLASGGSNPNVKDTQHQQTPAMYACKTGRLDILILLQSFGASLVITDEDGASCLSLAVRHGHAQIIDYLVSTHRVNINAKNPITGCTALMLAACRGDTAMTAHLLTYQHYNIDVDASSFIASTTNSYTPSSAAMKGNTALHIAAHRGHFDVVKLLVRDGGCDLSLRNLKGETAVLVAVKQNRIKIVRFLMDYSYNLQSQHHHQIMSPSLTETATSHDIRSSPPPPSSTSSTTNVAASPSSTTIALAQSHFFINNIANHEVAAKVDGSTTILARSSSSSSGSSSSSSDHSSTYSSSDDQSADSSHLILINDSDFKGWTALIWAAFMGNYELVQILVNNYGADVNIKGDDLIRKSSGGTSSVVTSSDLSPFSPDFSNSLETPQSPPVSATLTSGGNGGGGGGIHVNGMFAGRTALQTACRRGHTDIARFLLRSGADVHLKTSKGETALMFAAGSSSSSSSSHTTAVTSSTGFGLVQEMVEVWGADVRCAESVTGRTAYHFALDQGKAEVAKYLRDKMIYNSGGGGGKGTIAGSGNGISSLVDSGYDASSVVGDDQSSYFRDRIHSTSSTTTSHRSQENQDLECAICLEAFTENPGDFFYECDHRYHHKCYVGWRSTLTNVNNRINFSCPKCQRIELVI